MTKKASSKQQNMKPKKVTPDTSSDTASHPHPPPLASSCRSSSFAVGDFDPKAASSSSTDLSSPENSEHSSSSAASGGVAMSNHFSENNEDDLDNLVAVDDRTLQSDNEQHAGQHPALKTVCVVDCNAERRIIPNSDEPFVLENECFVGKVMLLMRTPDVDNHRDPHILGPAQQKVSEYFSGKKRRFEFQFQIKLKRVPEGPLFLGCELEQGIKVGTLTKGLVGILLAMVRRINPGFHYSWGPTDGHGKKLDPVAHALGDYEKTHLSFPVEASMDRIVITKPGDTPPVLGEELFETNESVKRRRKQGAGSVDWNTTDTFTMCLWSAYADWIKWKSINVPGVSPFSLCRVTGKQPIYLSVYEITSCKAGDEYRRKRPPHLQKDLKIYTRLEFSNDEKTVGGLAEKVVGRHSQAGMHSDQSLPDTESVSSDFDTMSRVSHITS